MLTTCQYLYWKYCHTGSTSVIKNMNQSCINRVVLMKKAQATIWKFFSPTFKFVKISFCTSKPNPLGLGNCSVSNFCKTHFRYFCSHMQQSYLCPGNQNYLLGKGDLRFFLSYGLRTTIKITRFSTFYIIGNFSSCYGWNSCKKYRLF